MLRRSDRRWIERRYGVSVQRDLTPRPWRHTLRYIPPTHTAKTSTKTPSATQVPRSVPTRWIGVPGTGVPGSTDWWYLQGYHQAMDAGAHFGEWFDLFWWGCHFVAGHQVSPLASTRCSLCNRIQVDQIVLLNIYIDTWSCEINYQ